MEINALKFKIVEEVKKVKPEDFGITKYKFRPDGTLDVFENVNINFLNLKELPFKFGKVDGDFKCNYNKLTSLKGAPKVINGDFFCDYNNLTTLKGAPEVVNGDFYCYGNRLKNLKGAPKIIIGNFIYNRNKLKSLEGLNLNGISGKILLKNNPNLKPTEKQKLWATLNPGRLELG